MVSVVQRSRKTRRGIPTRHATLTAGCFAIYLVAYIGFYRLNLRFVREEGQPGSNPSSRAQPLLPQRGAVTDIANQDNDTVGHDDALSHGKSRVGLVRSSIPRIIWQTSKSKALLPPEANETVSSWRNLNPDYDYRLFDDADVERFFLDEFPGRVYDAFMKLPLGVMKADMWRVAVIYLHGGVYADLDTLAKRPIDEWVGSNPECDAFVAQENKNDFCNWAFAAAPRHPAFERALYGIVEKIERDGGVQPMGPMFVVGYTGPPMFTETIREVLNATVVRTKQADHIRNRDQKARKNAQKMKLCLFDRKYFNGINANNKFASIFWNASSWNKWQSEQYRYYKKIASNATREEQK